MKGMRPGLSPRTVRPTSSASTPAAHGVRRTGSGVDFEEGAVPEAGLRNVGGHVVEAADLHAEGAGDGFAHELDIRVRACGDVEVDAAEGAHGDIVQANFRAGGRDVVGVEVLLAQGGMETFIEGSGLRVTSGPGALEACGVCGFGQGEDGGRAVAHDKRAVAPDGPPEFSAHDEEAMDFALDMGFDHDGSAGQRGGGAVPADERVPVADVGRDAQALPAVGGLGDAREADLAGGAGQLAFGADFDAWRDRCAEGGEHLFARELVAGPRLAHAGVFGG